MDLLNAPIHSMLKSYAKKKRVSFAMPGHKGGEGIEKDLKKNFFRYDVTELDDTDNLYMPGAAVKNARKLAAGFFGAQDTYFLVNGSTAGIYAMLAATCKPGDCIAVNRACHISVINACIILGLKPVFIPQEIISGFSVPGGINQKELIKILDSRHDIRVVLVTSPSYYGIASDIEILSKITRARGILLLADEAHGAHFYANSSIFPRTAISQGADMSVVSAHKTLNAMNQAAFLNLGSDSVDKARLESVLSMLQTSSPSYVIAASADTALAGLYKRGRGIWQGVYDRCERFKEKVAAETKVQFINTLLNGKFNIESVDETRIVMNFSAYKITGFKAAEILRKKYNIDVEMADIFNAVAIATAANKQSDYDRLAAAVIKICRELGESDEEPVFPSVPIPEMKVPPQNAFYAKGRYVRLDEAVGCAAKSTVTAYPPAVPIICTGETVSAEGVEYIKALQSIGARITGLNANGFIQIVE